MSKKKPHRPIQTPTAREHDVAARLVAALQPHWKEVPRVDAHGCGALAIPAGVTIPTDLAEKIADLLERKP